MTDLLVELSLYACWGAVVLVWIAGAAHNARHAPRERIRDRSGVAAYVVAIVICATVVSAGYESLHNLTVDAPWARVFGLAILIASTSFTLWARFSLGTMWSVAPEVGGDRHLRTGGPYGVTRHPIYTGMLGMLLGSMFLAGVHEFIVVLPAGLVVFEVKIRQEERLMLATFPDEYRDYRRRVPQIVPGLGVLRRGR